MKSIFNGIFKTKGILFIKDLIRSLFYFHLEKKLNSKIQVLSIPESISLIKSKRLSVSRFGDGEIRWMLNKKMFDSFQSGNDSLAEDLQKTFTSDLDKIAISLPSLPSKNVLYTFKEKVIWKSFWVKYGNATLKYIPDQRTFLNASITRPYMPFKKGQDEFVDEVFNSLKELWSNKRVLIVEGNKTRFALGSDFLANATMVKRIICPAHDAYSSINSILETTILESSKLKIDLILVALGPTATILVKKLSEQGKWAIDIGHADLEYNWYKIHAKKKVGIAGKEVNEVSKKQQKTLILESDLEKEYLDSQVAVIS